MLVPGDFDILRTDFRSDYTFIFCTLVRVTESGGAIERECVVTKRSGTGEMALLSVRLLCTKTIRNEM